MIADRRIAMLYARPFAVLKHGWEACLYLMNYIYWHVFGSGNIKLGGNIHVLGLGTFMAERPGAQVCIGNDFTAYYHCRIAAWGSGSIRIGNYCSLGSGTILDCRESVILGDHVLISWNVLVSDFDPHPIDPVLRSSEIEYSHFMTFPRFARRPAPDFDRSSYRFVTKPVVIESDVWIGARAIILKGVRIGRGSVVGAGSVVTRDVPEYSVVAGNPAKVVKHIPR